MELAGDGGLLNTVSKVYKGIRERARAEALTQ